MPERITYEWINREIGEAMEKPASRTVLYDLAALFMMRDRLKEGAEKHTERAEKKVMMPEVWKGPTLFDAETAEEWVHNMRNEDKNHPHGGKWTPESLKPFAQKYNIQYDTPNFWQFYAMTNAMYSDYSEVARKFGITSPEFYACMAKAFMDDMDAMPDKVARYYEYIAKK